MSKDRKDIIIIDTDRDCFDDAIYIHCIKCGKRYKLSPKCLIPNVCPDCAKLDVDQDLENQ